MQATRHTLFLLILFASCTPMNEEEKTVSDAFVAKGNDSVIALDSFRQLPNDMVIINVDTPVISKLDAVNTDQTAPKIDIFAVDVNFADPGSDVSFGLDSAEAESLSVCVPDCVDKECGDDGCGGSCGECGEDGVCDEGWCYYDDEIDFECLNLCLWFDSPSQTIVLFGFNVFMYQEAVFFTGKFDAPYPNLEVPAIIDNSTMTSYIPAPKDFVYKLFTLQSWDAWILIDATLGEPVLKGGLEYYCDANGCAILISERKEF